MKDPMSNFSTRADSSDWRWLSMSATHSLNISVYSSLFSSSSSNVSYIVSGYEGVGVAVVVVVMVVVVVVVVVVLVVAVVMMMMITIMMMITVVVIMMMVMVMILLVMMIVVTAAIWLLEWVRQVRQMYVLVRRVAVELFP
jgi:hypothetical protein